MTGARGRISRSISQSLENQCGPIIWISRTSGEGCISYEEAFEKNIFVDASAILHTTWSTEPATSESQPGIEWQSDLPLLAGILKSLKTTTHSKPRFILLSSGGTVYGNAISRSSIESDSPCPVGWYCRAKVAAESLCEHFLSSLGIPLLILRVSNPYGIISKSNRPQGLISAALESAKHNIPLKIWGDGSAIKDFLHCNDLADTICIAIKKPLTGIYNLGYGSSHRVKHVLNIIEKVIEKIITECTYAPI